MRKLLLCVLILVCAFSRMDANNHRLVRGSESELIGELDRALLTDDSIASERTALIASLKAREASAKSETDAYWLKKSIFAEYMNVNSDSALLYANACRAYALQQENASEIIGWDLNILSLYRSMGLFDNALAKAAEIDKSACTAEQLAVLNIIIMQLYANQVAYSTCSDPELMAPHVQNLTQSLLLIAADSSQADDVK